MSSIKNIFSESMIYSTADFTSRAIAYVLIPVFTFYLTVDQYGQLALYQSLMGVLFILMMWGTGSSLGSFYHFKEYKDNYPQIKSVAVRSLLCLNFIFLITAYLLITNIIELNRVLLALVLLASYFSVTKTSETIFFIHSHQPWKYFTLVTFYSTFNAILIFFVLKLKYYSEPLISIFSIYLFTNTIIFIYFLLRNKSIFREKSNLKLTKAIFAFGLPILPHAISQWILNFSDRFMLKGFLDYEAVGIYSLGYNFGMIMLVIIGSVGTSWGAHYLGMAEDDPQAFATLGVLASKIWYFYCLAGSVYVLWVKDLIFIATPPIYQASVPVAKWIIFSYLVYGSYLLFMNGLFAAKRTKLVPIASASAAIINIILNLFLIPAYGIIGAVIASFASFAIMAIIVFYLSNIIYPIDLTLGNFITPFSMFLFVFFISSYIETILQFNTLLIVKIILTLIFVLILYNRIRADGFK